MPCNGRTRLALPPIGCHSVNRYYFIGNTMGIAVLLDSPCTFSEGMIVVNNAEPAVCKLRVEQSEPVPRALVRVPVHPDDSGMVERCSRKCVREEPFQEDDSIIQKAVASEV